MRSRSECSDARRGEGGGRSFGQLQSSCSPGTHRPVIVVTVIVKQTLFLLQVEADPVMEASDLALFHFTCNEEFKVGGLGFTPFPSSPL